MMEYQTLSGLSASTSSIAFRLRCSIISFSDGRLLKYKQVYCSSLLSHIDDDRVSVCSR